MYKGIVFSILYLFSFWGFAQERDSLTLPIYTQKNKVRLNYMVLTMPEDFNAKGESMALGGLHYQVPITKNLYVGTNTHAALFGDQGGLFTLGVEAGINFSISKNLYLDTNLNFGGGGGYRSLINKGAYFNPSIGLFYRFHKINIGLQYNHFNFYTGQIKDNAISFSIEIPTEIQVASYLKRNNSYNISKKNNYHQKKSAFAIKLDQYLPIGNSRKDIEQNSELIRHTLYLLGFEYQKYINPKTFLFIHSDAMYNGLIAGFMDIFGGIGYEPLQTKHFSIFTKLGIGAAGGRIRAEGGATIYSSAGIDYHISDKVSLFGHVGYTKALDGYFEAYTFGGGIKFSTIPKDIQHHNPTKIQTKGIRISIQNQMYLDMKRQVREPLDQLHLLAIQFNYDLNKYLYLTGQAAFAYESNYNGDDANSAVWGAGGYADGMVGLGTYSPIFAHGKLQAFADILVGAGGGAGIDTGQGVISKIRIGGYYHINDYLSIIASGGKVISPFGGVNSNNINIGISVNFATLNTLFK